MPAQEYETIIGLEVHAQMNTKTKMFCACDNDAWGKPPNSTVCPVCMGHPGTLPVPNRAVVDKAVRASKALKGTVNRKSHFDRKNYFYPDLPSGFQISQYKHPLSSGGEVRFAIKQPDGNSGEAMTCRIHRLHIENDAGKLQHRGKTSLCDYNRAGTPLMEIVTEPDLRSAEQAGAFAQELRRILISADASEADMYKGMMRFDASISPRPKGDKKLYPRVEIKNLNSFKSLEKALKHQEALLRRQWDEGKAPSGETTVGWIDDDEKTVLLRDKESAADYRYFPEPDIPPLELDNALIESASGGMRKLPSEAKAEYAAMGLTNAEATMLIDQPELQTMFDAVKTATGEAKRASSLVLTQLLGFLKERNLLLSEGPSVSAMTELAKAIKDGVISVNAGKTVLEAMVDTKKPPAQIIKEQGLEQVSDTGAIEKLVQDALAANAEAVASYKAGKKSAIGVIVGWVMKQSKGQANPGMVSGMLMKELG